MINNLSTIVIQVVAFLVAITIHEASHAWMAFRLGDPTAKLRGRLSLNPIAHIDLYGTVLIPLFLILIGSPFVFGWAKPVMFDVYNLKNPRKDSALIALAGPVSNLIFSILIAFVLSITNLSQNSFLGSLFFYIIAINIVLAIFNLIPIHPLDGGKIFIGLLPEKDAQEADFFLRRYGIFLLILLIFPIFGGRSPLSYILWPTVNFVLKLLTPANF